MNSYVKRYVVTVDTVQKIYSVRVDRPVIRYPLRVHQGVARSAMWLHVLLLVADAGTLLLFKARWIATYSTISRLIPACTDSVSELLALRACDLLHYFDSNTGGNASLRGPEPLPTSASGTLMK